MLGGDRPSPVVSEYVQSGLVLHLDARSPGETEGAWTSLVGNHVFTNHGAVFNDDHVLFDGVDDYLLNTSFTPPYAGSATIEMVYDCDANVFGVSAVCLFAGKTGGSLCFYISSGTNIYWTNGTPGKITPHVNYAKASVSISDARKYENGVAITHTSSNYLGGRDSSNYIGKRSSGNLYKGKFYAIRIYNRQLTEAEVMQNLAVDNIRYQLGLTL